MQAQRAELDAWKHEQEAGITATAEAQQLQLATIQEQRRELQDQAAEQAKLQVELQAQAVTAEEAAALQERQQQLAAQQAEVGPTFHVSC